LYTPKKNLQILLRYRSKNIIAYSRAGLAKSIIASKEAKKLKAKAKN
jgi:hypothetical protein